MTLKSKGTPEEGYISVWRRFFRHRFWTEKRTFNRAEAWLDCLQRAAYAPHDRYFKGQLVHLERGQFAVSQKDLAHDWRRGEKWVRRFLRELSEHEEAVSAAHPWGTLITIVQHAYCPIPGRTGGRTDHRTEGARRARPEGTIEERKEGKEETTQLPRGDSVGQGPFPSEGVGRVFEAFQRAIRDDTRCPSARERTKMQAAIEANGGDFQAIADFVFNVTRAAVDDGEPIGSVNYGLVAWKNRHNKRASQARAGRDLPRDRVQKPPYHGAAKVGPKPPMNDSESKAGGEHVRGILERLGFKPSKGN